MRELRIKKPDGVILVILLLCLPLILLFIAFVINLGMAYASLEQARSYARVLALQAMEEYSRDTGPLDERLRNLRRRVNEVARQNFLLSKPNEQFLPLGFAWSIDGGDQDAEAAGGVIWPGRYEFPRLNEVPPTPATFQPMTRDEYDRALLPNSVEPGINAIRITANFAPSIPFNFMGPLFNNLTGAINVPIDAQATAAVIPQEIIFLIDISNSSVAETHKLRSRNDQACSPEQGRGGYFAFHGFSINLLNPPVCTEDPEQEIGGDRSHYCQWRFLSDFDPTNPAIFNCVNGAPTQGAYILNRGPVRGQAGLSVRNSKLHFKDDYGQRSPVQIVLWDRYVGDMASGVGMHGQPLDYRTLHARPAVRPDGVIVEDTPVIDRYRVDTVTDPEPLTSIFAGLYAGVEQFMIRRRSGDRAGLIFMERKLRWSRMVNITNEFGYLKTISDYSNQESSDNRERIFRLGLFPTYEKFSDIYLGIQEGIRQLSSSPLRASGVPVASSVVYIGDFLPNCKRNVIADLDGNGPVNDQDRIIFDTCCSASPGQDCSRVRCDSREDIERELNNPGRVCSDRFGFFDEAVADINQLVMDEMVPRGIMFSAIHIGRHVAPHIVDIPSPGDPTRCLTDQEARKDLKDYVLGGDEDGLMYRTAAEWGSAYTAMSETNPFYQAGAEAYRLTRATGGVFAPVRISDPGVCRPDDECRAVTVNSNGVSVPFRRTQDRECRDARAQVIDYMTQIVQSESPYRIVETN